MPNEQDIESDLIELVKSVSNALDQGVSASNISAGLVDLGMPKPQADQFVAEVSSVRAQASTGQSSHLKNFLLEAWYLIASAVALWCAAVAISFVLGLFEPILDLVGMGGLGAVLAKFGEMAAGAGLGALASAASTESRSIGMFVGCWLGVIAYYAWFWYMIY